jgi:ribonuclease T
MPDSAIPITMATRFRGFLPVVVDVETGGFDPKRHALLEIAATPIRMDDEGRVYPDPIISAQVQPFAGADFDPRSLEITGIDPYSALRAAVPEGDALKRVFAPVRKAIKAEGCERAVLVGHNAAFDLSFLNATVRRVGLKRNPFHPFSCFDTATLAGLAYGQTVLGKAVTAAGLAFDSHAAHSAVYDTERTAQLFCIIVNRWKALTEAGRLPVSD